MGIEDDEVLHEDLVYYITQMDEVYLTYAKELSEAQNKTDKRPPGNPGKSEW